MRLAALPCLVILALPATLSSPTFGLTNAGQQELSRPSGSGSGVSTSSSSGSGSGYSGDSGMAGGACSHGSKENDLRILNFALMFSHLASSFYHSSLSRYDDKCFEDKGYPPWVRSRLHQIKGNENMHIQFLEETIKGSGGEPVQKCDYNFPDHEPSHVVEFGEAIASIFVSALNGALKEVESKEYASAIGSILGVEARVSAWLNSAVKKQSPWNMAFETPVTFAQAYSILLNFISSCPPHNSDLLPSSLQRFPALRLPSGGIESGVEIELEFDEERYRKGGVLFGAFMVGTGTYIERVRIVEQCEKKGHEGAMSSGSGSGYGSGSGAGYSPSGDGNSASTPSSGYTSEISLEDHVKNRYFLTPPADLSGKGAVYITLVQSDTDVDREAAEVVSSILRDDNTVAGPVMAMFPFDSNGDSESEVDVEVEVHSEQEGAATEGEGSSSEGGDSA